MYLASLAFPLAIQVHGRDAFIFTVLLKTLAEKKRTACPSPTPLTLPLFLYTSVSFSGARDSYRNFKLRHFATRFITSINYFGRKGWQGEFQTSGFPYVRRKVRRVQLSRISRFHPAAAPLFSFFNLFRFTCTPAPSSCLSLIFCHSLVTDQRSPARPSGPNNLYRFHPAAPVPSSSPDFSPSSSPRFSRSAERKHARDARSTRKFLGQSAR